MRYLEIILLYTGIGLLPLHAQQDSTMAKFPGEHQFGKTHIYLNNRTNTFIKASEVTIIDDSLLISEKIPYDSGGGKKNHHLHLSDIYIIKTKTGSYAGEYCLAGALLCGVSALIGVNDNSSTYQYGELDKGTKKSVVLGFTLAGFVIGGIWGASTPKWETIYRMDNVSQTRLHIRYRLACRPETRSIGLNVAFNYL